MAGTNKPKATIDGQNTPYGQPIKQVATNRAEATIAGHCHRRAIAKRLGIAEPVWAIETLFAFNRQFVLQS